MHGLLPGLESPCAGAPLPLPDDPELALQHLRRLAEAEILRLIALLDLLDGDPDLEPSLGVAGPDECEPDPDVEHTALERSGKGFVYSGLDDAEDADPAENSDPAEDDLCGLPADADGTLEDKEPSLGAPERNGFIPGEGGWGWPQTYSQAHWADGTKNDREDEHDGREDIAELEDDPAEMGIGDADGLHLDDEPSLGWPEGRTSQGIGSLGGTGDRELDSCDAGERVDYVE